MTTNSPKTPPNTKIPLVEKPNELSLVANIQIVNRHAEVAGISARMSNRPLKSMLKFRNRFRAPSYIQVSTMKDTLCPKYDVSSIQLIHKPFLDQGMITIQTAEARIFVKNGKKEELEAFLSAVAAAREIDGGNENGKLAISSQNSASFTYSPETTCSASSASKDRQTSSSGTRVSRDGQVFSLPVRIYPLGDNPSSSASSENQSKSKSKPPFQDLASQGPLRQSTLNFQQISSSQRKANFEKGLEKFAKRRRSPSPVKGAKAKLKKALKNSASSVTAKIKSKSDYFSAELSQHLEELTINEIGLKKIDSRVLILANLVQLNLSSNNLSNVDSLRQLRSPLKTLILSDNRITRLDPRLKFAFGNLLHLDLSRNLLTLLPDSFVHLPKLCYLDVSRNKLTCLPYNVMYLGNLRTLLANHNELTFVPHPLVSAYGFPRLEKVDISSNPNLKWQGARFPVLRQIRHGFGSKSKDAVGTLMELAGAAIINFGNSKYGSQRQKICHYRWPEGTLPASLMEYLDKGKRCVVCFRNTLRYAYSDEGDFARNLGDHVTADQFEITSRKAICPNNEHLKISHDYQPLF